MDHASLSGNADSAPFLREPSPANDPEEQSSPVTVIMCNFENDITPETATTGRQIGWYSAYILVISRVIGSGIFAMPGSVIQTVGSPGLALLLWVVGAVIAWAGLAMDMEYGCMLPRSGGIKVYLEYTYRRPKFFASVMVATQAILLGFTATNCIIFAKYTIYAVGATPGDMSKKLLAAGLMTVVTIIHGCFYRTGLRIQNILGWLKMVLVSFMIVTSVFIVLFSSSDSSTIKVMEPSWWQEAFRGSDWAWNNLATAFFKVFYAYAGLNNINNVMNEVKNPVHALKTVGPAALWTACIMYLLINVVYLAVIPLSDIKQSRELIAALFFEKSFGARLGGVFLPLCIATSAAGNVMVVTFSLGRLNQEIARQGFLPFAEVLASSKPFGAPLGGLVVHYIPSVLIIVGPPSSTVYSFIADVEGYSSQFYLVAVAAGLILLRYSRPEVIRPYKAWLPAVWIRMALSLALILAPLFPSKTGHSDVNFFYATYALVALALLLIGVLYWSIWLVLLPRLRGFNYSEQEDVLDDGTVINRLVREKA